MAKNSLKAYNVTTSNVVWPKMVKTAKTRKVLDTAMSLNDLKQLPQVSDQVLDKFDVRIRRKCPNTLIFLAKNGQKWQKLAIFGQNLENNNFFQNSAWNIFLDSSRCSFVQKIIKIWCAVF